MQSRSVRGRRRVARRESGEAFYVSSTDNGKPIERWGRKGTGLPPLAAGTVAGLPK